MKDNWHTYGKNFFDYYTKSKLAGRGQLIKGKAWKIWRKSSEELELAR